MKILFTSVGRRVELMQVFHNAANKLNIDLEIYGADITDTAPALYYCEHTVIVPRIKDEAYIPALLEICEREHIDALIPTIDTDLLILSKTREQFESIGTKVFIANPEKVAICRDKRLTADYFRSLGLNSPVPVDDYKKYNDGFPAFIKPIDGSSSINAFKVTNDVALKILAEEIGDYIIQPFIDGTEYTVDTFCDYNGNPIYITPRIRMAVRSGEVLKTQMVQDDKIIEEARRILADFKPRGQMAIQLIRDKNTGEDYYIEINPRFGGGSPLSIMAGADSASAVLKILKGDVLEYQEKAAEDGAVFSRFDQCVRIK